MFALIQSLIAWAVAMLAASLFVTAATQLLRRISRLDRIAVDQFVRSVYYGFRSANEHRPDDADAWDARAQLFAQSVVGAAQARQSPAPTGAFTADDKPEYIDHDDLVGIVYRVAKTQGRQVDNQPAELPPGADPNAKEDTPAWVKAQPSLKLPSDWFGDLSYATTRNFASYVDRWADTLERTTIQIFKMRMKRISLVVGAATVILLNIDGFELLKGLYGSQVGRDAFLSEASNLQVTAARLGLPQAPLPAGEQLDTSSKQLLTEMQKTSVLLTYEPVHVGWNNSPIAKLVCAAKGQCDDVVRPTVMATIGAITFWMFGLVFSWAMIGLGAPFWYSVLQSSLRWTNEIKASKEPEPPTPQKAPAPPVLAKPVVLGNGSAPSPPVPTPVPVEPAAIPVGKG